MRNEEGTNRGNQPNPQNQLIVREIHTISRGWRRVYFSKKSHARSIHIEEVYQIERPFKIQKKDTATISVSDKDAKRILMPHDDALVVTMTIANHTMH
jgi:hypothetical protein